MSRRLLPVLALLFTASACSSYHYDNGPPRAPAPIQIEPATDYRPEHESLSQGDADEEIMSGLQLISMYADMPYVKQIVHSDRFKLLNYEFINVLGDWRTVNEFVDMLQGICDLIIEKETAYETGAGSSGFDSTQLDGLGS